MSDRNHLYLYTVEVRGEKRYDEHGKWTGAYTWTTHQVEAYNMDQATHKLEQQPLDVRYVNKVIIQ